MQERTPVTRLGFQMPSFTYPGVSDPQLFDRIAAIATTVDRSGFDSIWVMDHLYQISNVGEQTEPMFEAYTLLGAIAARTERVRLGTLVTGVTYRNPALLAKIITSLDVISSGRAILGIGAAWNEAEHRGYGFDFPPLRERFDRLEEALHICRAMFTEATPTFTGRYYRIDSALNYPRPVTPGGPPILIGGSGERRTIPLVARYADACNFFGDEATIRHKLEVLDAACERVGRDPADITRTRLGGVLLCDTRQELERRLAEQAQRRSVSVDRVRGYFLAGTVADVIEQAGRYRAAGLDGLIFNMPDAYNTDIVATIGEALSNAVA